MRYLAQIGFLAAIFHQVVGDNLILVHAVWRHGDRAPTGTFPTDTNDESKWPQGWGQLTTIGMQEHYTLGARLRAMYGNFISPSYKADEIYVRSTDIDRTLMSAMSNLAGFYQAGTVDVDYPSTANVPNWPSSWSPVPVHTVDISTDFIGYSLTDCARADQLIEQFQQTDSYKNLTATNQQFFARLTNFTGFPIPVTLENLYVIQDALFIESVHNLPWPAWCTADVYEKIDTLNSIADDILFGISSPRVPELMKLRGGSLLKDINDRMVHKVACMNNPSNSSCASLNNLKYYVYSAHDITVDALLATFGDKEEVVGSGLPRYAASIVLELWNTSTGPQVKIQYHPSFNVSYFPITNLTCGCNTTTDYCKLDTFVSRNQYFMPQNITAECQRQSDAAPTTAAAAETTTTTVATTTTTTVATTTTTIPAATTTLAITATSATAPTTAATATTAATTATTTPSASATITTWFTFTTQIMFSAIVLLFTAVNRHGH